MLWARTQQKVKIRFGNIYVGLICLLLIILAAFRSDNVGADTSGYRLTYMAMGDYHSIQDIVDRFTDDYIVYYILSKIFHFLRMPVQVWFGFIEAFYLFALMKLVNKFSRDKIFSLLVYTTIGLFTFSMAGLKQTMAMSLMMLAFIALIEKKYIFTALLVVTTYYTHQSALILLAAFPIYYIRNARFLITFILGLCVLIYIYDYMFIEAMVETMGNERWESYLVTDSRYSFVTLIFYVVITFIAGINLKNYNTVEPDNANLFLGLSILACGLQVLASVSPSLFRLAYLYTPFMMILLPNASYYSKHGKMLRGILMSCIVFYFLYTNRHWTYSFVSLW